MEKTGSKLINRTDEELVFRARTGDQEACSALVRKYAPGLLAHIREYLSGAEYEGTGVEMAEEPQDICQETFQKAFLHLDRYDGQYSFSTWLYNIGKNAAIDYSRKRRIAVGARISPEGAAGLSSHIGKGIRNSPEDRLIGNQEYESLLRHIRSLGPLYREAAELRFIHEFAYEEIARALDLPLNTVRTRLRRAKTDLIRKIEE